MKQNEEIGLDFVIDKLTNSIENVTTGDSFPTEISVLTDKDIKSITKKKDWIFDWLYEYQQPDREVYKLTIVNNSTIIQGLISVEIKSDHVFIHLIESASFNQGKAKVYRGVSGNLVAFACKLSFRYGHEGNVVFISKTNLIKHYEEILGARHSGGQRMLINNISALKLTNKYFL